MVSVLGVGEEGSQERWDKPLVYGGAGIGSVDVNEVERDSYGGRYGDGTKAD